MRVLTWNLQAAGGSARVAAQLEILAAMHPDVAVLTEPSDVVVRDARVVSPARDGKSWIVIAGPTIEPVELSLPFERLAACASATDGMQNVLVYGAVLPWTSVGRDAHGFVREGETPYQTFERVLAAQVADIEALRGLHPRNAILWVGDFNQTLKGPNFGGSKRKRDALTEALRRLGLVAWNADAASAEEGLHTIDLVCGPPEIEVIAQGRIEPTIRDLPLSDHAGYWVDLAFPRRLES